jgi:hypothetical protein
VEIVIGWVIFSIVAGVIASGRGRSGFGYFLLSLLLSPLIGILLAVALPSKREVAPVRDAAGEVVTPQTHVRCPDCRELVRADALKCKHCGTRLVPQQIS